MFRFFKSLKAEILIPIFLACFSKLDVSQEELESTFKMIKSEFPAESFKFMN